MGQDMMKGRRTEIEFLNGFVVGEGEQVGIQARPNERLVDIVKKVERGELKQDPRHITELRLNRAPAPSASRGISLTAGKTRFSRGVLMSATAASSPPAPLFKLRWPSLDDRR
jgi:Ketopantoate reductase PanE/ApbA C terminal